MKKLLFIIAFLPSVLFSQTYADKNYYLLDSLDLKSLSKEDRKLIDSCLNVYHKSENDTVKLNALVFIVEECWDDDVWPKYNQWVYDFVLNKLKSNKQIRPNLKKYYSTILADTKNNIGYYYTNIGDAKGAIDFYLGSLELEKSMNDTLAIATTYLNLASIYRNQGNVQLALNYLDKCLQVNTTIDNKVGIASALVGMGGIYQAQGNIPQAIENFSNSLKIQEQIGDKNGMATSYMWLGVIHKNQNKSSLALKYFNQSLKLFKELNDPASISQTLHNIGAIYEKDKNFEMALKYYRKSLPIRLYMNDQNGIGQSYNNIGGILIQLDSVSTGLDYLNRSLNLFEKINNKVWLAYTLNKLSRFQIELNNVDEAKINAEKAMSVAKSISHLENVKRAAKNLYLIYKKKGLGMKALEMHEIYMQTKDSLHNNVTEKAALEQQARYEYEKQHIRDSIEYHKQILVEEAEIARQNTELKAKRNQQYALLVGIVIVFVFAIFIYNRYKVTQEQKEIIAEANEELFQTNEELASQRDQIEKQRDQIEIKHNEIQESISYAKQIQDALLRNEENTSPHMPEHFIFFKPKDIVSGDFYWTLEKQDHLYLAAADCTGHGVPGAFLTMLGTSFLNEINSTYELRTPAEILDVLRERIVKELSQNGEEGESKDGMDISLIRLNLKTNEMQWAGANNPIYILRHSALDAESPIEVTKADREPIGYAKNMTPFTNHEFTLQKGDTIYLFSDGYADQFGGPKGKKFSYKQLRNLFVEISTKPMLEQKRNLNTAFENWIAQGEEEQIDDVCIVGIRL